MWAPGVVYNGHSRSEYRDCGCTNQQSMSLFHRVINNCITVCISFADVCVEVIIYYVIISERELTFAICCCRPSVVCLSVTLVHPTQVVVIFHNISMALGTLAIH